jgi:hypothetical protein
MWASLALAAALAPAQQGDLALKNARATYGVLGQERKEKVFLIGDVFTLSFDVEGLKVKEDGQVQYSIGMELVNTDKKKTEFKQEPRDQEAVNSLGGNRMPAFAMVEIRIDSEPGNYLLIVTVTDRIAKVSRKLEYPFRVAKAELGFVQTSLTYPAPENYPLPPAPPIAAAGQLILVNFAVVGFEIKGDQPNVEVEMSILDENGKPTLPKPYTGKAQGAIPERLKKILPFQFALQLNRSGKYKIHLKVTDKNNNGKVAEQFLEFQVYEVK